MQCKSFSENTFVEKTGALTSKKYAFISRNWELKSFESIDFTDSMGNNIRIDTKGNFIYRILPSINEYINEEWISDRIRFYNFDIILQRIYNPMFLYRNKHIKCSWFFIISFSIFINSIHFLYRTIEKYNFFLQDNYHIEELYKFKFFLNINGIYELANSGKNYNNLEFFYNFNTLLINLENIDLFFFLNINLRTNFPILNLKMRKIINEKENDFYGCYMIGYMKNYSFQVKQITNNMKELFRISEGKHWFCLKLQESENPMFLSKNSNIFNCTNYLIFLKYFYKYNFFFFSDVINFNNIGKYLNYRIIWNFFFYKENVEKKKKIWLNRYKTYNFFYGNIEKFIKKNDFLIYQGYNIEKWNEMANIILPTHNFFEKNGIYLNFEQIFSNQYRIFYMNKNLKTNIQILTLFLNKLNLKKKRVMKYRQIFTINLLKIFLLNFESFEFPIKNHFNNLGNNIWRREIYKKKNIKWKKLKSID